MNLFCVFLLDQLTGVVFFISKDVIVGRNRGRIGHAVPLHLLPFRLGALGLLVGPLLMVHVAAWPWGQTLLLDFGVVARLEPVDSRGEGIGWFDDRNSKLLQAIHAEVLSRLHVLRYLVEAHLCLVAAGTGSVRLLLRRRTLLDSLRSPTGNPASHAREGSVAMGVRKAVGGKRHLRRLNLVLLVANVLTRTNSKRLLATQVAFAFSSVYESHDKFNYEEFELLKKSHN